MEKDQVLDQDEIKPMILDQDAKSSLLTISKLGLLIIVIDFVRTLYLLYHSIHWLIVTDDATLDESLSQVGYVVIVLLYLLLAFYFWMYYVLQKKALETRSTAMLNRAFKYFLWGMIWNLVVMVIDVAWMLFYDWLLPYFY